MKTFVHICEWWYQRAKSDPAHFPHKTMRTLSLPQTLLQGVWVKLCWWSAVFPSLFHITVVRELTSLIYVRGVCPGFQGMPACVFVSVPVVFLFGFSQTARAHWWFRCKLLQLLGIKKLIGLFIYAKCKFHYKDQCDGTLRAIFICDTNNVLCRLSCIIIYKVVEGWSSSYGKHSLHRDETMVTYFCVVLKTFLLYFCVCSRSDDSDP